MSGGWNWNGDDSDEINNMYSEILCSSILGCLGKSFQNCLYQNSVIPECTLPVWTAHRIHFAKERCSPLANCWLNLGFWAFWWLLHVTTHLFETSFHPVPKSWTGSIPSETRMACSLKRPSKTMFTGAARSSTRFRSVIQTWWAFQTIYNNFSVQWARWTCTTQTMCYKLSSPNANILDLHKSLERLYW